MAKTGRRGTQVQFWSSDGATPPGPDTLLWEDAMHTVPIKDGEHEYAFNGDPYTTYEVVRVIMRHTMGVNPDPPNGQPEGPDTANCRNMAIVIVVEP